MKIVLNFRNCGQSFSFPLYVHTRFYSIVITNRLDACDSLSIILYSALSITALVFYIKKLFVMWKVYELQQLNTRCQMIAPAIFVVLWPSIVNVNLSLNAKKICLCDALCHFFNSLLSTDYMQIKIFLWFFYATFVYVDFVAGDFLVIVNEWWRKIVCQEEF